MIAILISGMCFGQPNFSDTVYYNNGKKKVCKFKSETSTQILFQTKDENGVLDWFVGKDKIAKYVVQTRTGPNEVIISDKPFVLKSGLTLPTLKDSVNYLMAEINKQKSTPINIVTDINISGNRIRNAGLFAFGSLAAGAVSGLCFALNQEAREPEYAMNAGYIFAGIAAACSLAVPIELLMAGSKLKKLK